MKKIIWIIVAAVVLLGGVAAAVLLWPSGQQEQPQENAVKLYWNVEQAQHAGLNSNGQTVRTPREDGLYYIRFAFDGGQQELPVAQRELVDIIDMQQVMGLVLDENGIVTDVQTVSQCTGGIAANNYYVEKVEGNTLTVNMLGDGSGARYTLKLDENTQVYNVGTADIMCGLPAQVQVDDQIYALWSMDKTRITHVFTSPYTPPGVIYWNVNRYYDAAAKISTRPIDATGTYTIDMYVDGEPVTFTTKDQKIANAIDGRNPRWMGLQLDEEGNLAAVVSPIMITGGSLLGGNRLTVVSITGSGITLAKPDGSPVESSLATGYKVIDGTSSGNGAGTMTDLREGDIVYCLTDCRDRICYALVIGGRLSGQKMYWNVDRQWDKTTQSTLRKPDKDGWYYFKMAVDGKHITVKTNNLTFANEMESPVCCSLKLDGEVVVDVPGSALVHGGNVFASWYVVDSVENGVMTASRDGKTVSAPFAKDCEFYNTSDVAELEGEKTDGVMVGDTVHCFTNKQGEIAIAYVVTRRLNLHAYWNLEKGVTHQPDADGWYYVTMATEGRQEVVKTKDPAIVERIEERTAMLLAIHKGEVVGVYNIVMGAKTSSLWGTYYTVTALEGNKITASNGEKTITATISTTADIFDVSNTAKLRGERTQVQVGDTIHSMKNPNGKLSLIFVTTRPLPDKEFYCAHCDSTLAFTGWDGGSTISKSGHYYLYDDVPEGAHRTFGVADQKLDIVLCLNGKTYQTPGRVMMVNYATTFSIIDPNGGGQLVGGGEPTYTHSGVLAIIHGDATVNIYGGTLKLAEGHNDISKGGAITASGTLNMYGGTVIGGAITGNGGAICVSSGRTFNMYGGTVTGGSVNKEMARGGNIYVEGTMNLYGGMVEGGRTTTGSSHGGNIYVAGTLNISGGTVKNGRSESGTHAGNIYIAGTANISGGTITGGYANSGKGHDLMLMGGKLNVSGGSMGKLWMAYIAKSGDVTLSGAPEIGELNMAGTTNAMLMKGLTGGSVGIAIDSGEKNRIIATGCTEGDLAYLKCLEDGELTCTDGNLSIGASVVGHAHCFCVGAEELPAGHTCNKKTVWQPITATTTISQSGFYYLDWSGLKAAALTINAKDVYLCLNGANIRAQTTITLKDGASLTVCDCVGTGVIMTTRYTPVTVPKNTEFNLYSGTVTGTYAPTTSRISVKVTGGTFNMYGGAIKDGCSLTTATYADKSTHGGNVQILNGTFNMYGGLITGGKSGTYGGNISLLSDNGVFNMYGGKVTNGIAGTHGGNIAVALGDIYIYGGTIEGGTSSTYGANISVVNTSTAMITVGTVDASTVYAYNPDNLTYKDQE